MWGDSGNGKGLSHRGWQVVSAEQNLLVTILRKEPVLCIWLAWDLPSALWVLSVGDRAASAWYMSLGVRWRLETSKWDLLLLNSYQRSARSLFSLCVIGAHGSLGAPGPKEKLESQPMTLIELLWLAESLGFWVMRKQILKAQQTKSNCWATNCFCFSIRTLDIMAGEMIRDIFLHPLLLHQIQCLMVMSMFRLKIIM